jgi:PBSX family phage terminase large subunit
MREITYDDLILDKFRYPFTHDVLCYYGARSTGKTYNMVRNIIIKSHKENVSVLCIRNTLSSLEDSCYAEIKEALDDFEIDYKATVNPLKITTEFGVKFFFKGLDKPDKIKSIKATPRLGIVWFEEATEIPNEEIARKVMLSVRDGKRHYVFTYNPDVEEHWLKK